MLTQKWERKKDSGDVLSKQELKERANWTPEQKQLNEYQEQLKKAREGDKRTQIANKISSGQKLTKEEEEYMATYDPQGLADYKQTQSERKAYEEKLKNCKTKDEVQKLKTTTLGNHLISLKKIINNPVIPLSEKLKKAQQILGKTKNIQAAEEEFIESGKYAELDTEAEQAKERAEDTKAENEIANAVVEESVDTDDKAGAEKSQSDKQIDRPKEAAVQIQEIYNHLKLSKQIEEGLEDKPRTENKKRIGKKVDYSV